MKKKIEKKIPNFDTTYCVSKDCKNRCWRHITNYKFEPRWTLLVSRKV